MIYLKNLNDAFSLDINNGIISNLQKYLALLVRKKLTKYNKLKNIYSLTLKFL